MQAVFNKHAIIYMFLFSIFFFSILVWFNLVELELVKKEKGTF